METSEVRFHQGGPRPIHPNVLVTYTTGYNPNHWHIPVRAEYLRWEKNEELKVDTGYVRKYKVIL